MTEELRARVEFERWIRMAHESVERMNRDTALGRGWARDDVERRDRYVGYALALVPVAYPDAQARTLARVDVARALTPAGAGARTRGKGVSPVSS
jgi:hypothetical protein